jgi:hypothetical protein
METTRRRSILSGIFVLLPVLLLALPVLTRFFMNPPEANAQASCTAIKSPTEIPAPILINFDDIANAALIGDHYRPSFGVKFENDSTTQATIHGDMPAKVFSKPNFASNDPVAPNTSAGVPMTIDFDSPKTHVGFYVGNAGTDQISGLLTAYDVQGAILCQSRIAVVPDPINAFLGVYDTGGRIVRVTLDYFTSTIPEAIDNLYFAPGPGIAPTRTPLPTWTPVPSATPTPGPTATPTPIVPVFAYYPVQSYSFNQLLKPDLSIFGIEITQGIQCFDTSKGLSTCPNNSLPVVIKKDTTARIYLKYSSTFSTSGLPNVPVRLHIFANGVEYIGNATGKATTTLNQANHDDAEIYFNVNFSNDVQVGFYAEVDPDNTIAETNETNNRYPSTGLINLTFHHTNPMTIVGQRLYYHPSGYSGSNYASGWAVNGGAADWYEQVLPIRNNGINYYVKSGYLNWTQDLSDPDAQHNLIKTLNAQWILENAFSFWFSGAFTGATHVYGWAPNAGYSGGHADMPIYPHAGGLGVVGIGTDRPGTDTDNPGGGALIFGHELTHDYNVLHTNTVDSCGSNDSASDFPYGSSSIQEFGFNPYTGKIYNPSNTHDLMSYCPANGSKQGWIAPFTWNKMYNDLALTASKSQQGPAQPMTLYTTNATQSLVVNATIYNPANNPSIPGKLDDLYKTEGGVAYTLPSGDYSIELRDISNAVLSSQSFIVDFESEYTAGNASHGGEPHAPGDAPPFPPAPTDKVDVSFIIPWVDGTTSVALVHSGQTIDQRPVSANPPQVLITDPTTSQTWHAGEKHDLQWQGLDLDGDPLTYTVSYSHDGGANWILLADELTVPTYTVNVDDMAGGSDVRFRVIATDGVNTGVDETDQAISIPNKAPQVTILNPAPGAHIPVGGVAVLQGSGTDMEDGILPDSALTWSSDRQGTLGIGPSLPLNNLLPGWHTLTLTGVDSNGIAVSATVRTYIGVAVYLPLAVR